MTDRSARRRVTALGCLLLLVPPLALGIGPSVAGAPPPGGAACPAPTYPPGQPYQLAVSGTLVGHLTISASPAGPLTLPPITGSFCGLLQLPSERTIVQPANLHFAPISASFARAVVPSGVTASGPSVGTVLPQPAANGGLQVTLSAPVAASAGLLGVQCSLPVQLDLSTLAPGGLPVTGPLGAATATVVADGFAVQPALSTGAAGTCPSFLADQVDDLLGLPNSNTSTNVQLSLDISLQQ